MKALKIISRSITTSLSNGVSGMWADSTLMSTSFKRKQLISCGSNMFCVYVLFFVFLSSIFFTMSAFADTSELENGREVGNVQWNKKADFEYESDIGSIQGDVIAGAEGQVRIGENGVEASGSIGLAAELEAASKQLNVGNEDVGGSAQIEARLQALAGAQGEIGLYFDEQGLTIGAEGRAGAFVSASASLNLEAHVFGLEATMKLSADAHAGFLAAGKAKVEIGWDGHMEFTLGAGLSVGVGASLGMEFGFSAQKLIDKLGLSNLEELIVWVRQFVENPLAFIDQIVDYAQVQLWGWINSVISERVQQVIRDGWNFLMELGHWQSEVFQPYLTYDISPTTGSPAPSPNPVPYTEPPSQQESLQWPSIQWPEPIKWPEVKW
ncbi:MAG: hypothetical protein EOM12_04200 [Verrucomicrobiae bacterium]|nr:hypothetical protein [Verrucomicrobiae bacterium]